MPATLLVYVGAAVAEIAGCFAFWAWLRLGKSAWWIVPGLVSLAQVRFRYSENLRDARVALEYDLYYVKSANWSIDIRIFGRAALLAARDWWQASGKLFTGTVQTARRLIVPQPAR